MKALHCIVSFALVTAFAMIIAVSFVFVVNRTNTNSQNSAIDTLFRETEADWARTNEDWVLLRDYQDRIADAFNETATINTTLQVDLQYLDAYVCQQYVRLNNVTPGCAGAFNITGTGNVTIDNDPGFARVIVNGTAFETQLNEDQLLITQILTNFAFTSLELSILNAEAVKSINGVTVNPQGNIDVNGTCGVEVKKNPTFHPARRAGWNVGKVRRRC
jgi:hypothetical protein